MLQVGSAAGRRSIRALLRTTRVTLHHVAAKAGVSIATVSRALNGLPVAADNLQKVEEAAAALGYVPNEAARSLRSDRTLTLGLIFFQLGASRGMDVLESISTTVEQAGYSLLISTARGDPAKYDLLMRRFLERRVDGLFVSLPHGEGVNLSNYEASGIPVLALGTTGPAFASLPRVRPKFTLEQDPSVQHLLSQGHRKIAWIDDAEPLSAAAAMGAAWQRGPFVTEPIPVPELGGMDVLLRDLLARNDRPTVVTGPEHHASAFLAACRIAGVHVPGDFSVVAVTNSETDRRARQQDMSSVLVDAGLLGLAAGEAMIAWLGGERPPETVEVEIARWMPRATTGPAT